jgi:hypothetical protein
MKRILVLIMCLVLCGCNGCFKKTNERIKEKPEKKIYPAYFEKITGDILGNAYILHYQGCDYICLAVGGIIHSETCPNQIHNKDLGK